MLYLPWNPIDLISPPVLLFLFQKQAMLVRQLEEEVVKSRQYAKETNPEIKAHIEALQIENDALTREIAILKETIKVRTALKTMKCICVCVCVLCLGLS